MFIDAPPLIADPDLHRFAFAGQRDAHRPPGRGEFQRIIHQVTDSLGQPCRITLYRSQIWAGIHNQLNFIGQRLAAQIHRHISQDRRQITKLARLRQTRIQARQVQQRIHQAHHPLGRIGNVPQEKLLLLIERRGLRQHVHKANNRVQRCAQIMRNGHDCLSVKHIQRTIGRSRFIRLAKRGIM